MKAARNPNPTHLYKYRALNELNLQNLRDRRIWIPTIQDFNDPFDGKLELAIQNAVDKYKMIHINIPNGNGTFHSIGLGARVTPEERPEIERLVRSELNEHNRELSRLGVYCTSARCDDVTMWAHYADSHKGFCLEFERSGPWASPHRTNPMDYIDEYPTIDFGRRNNITPGRWLFLMLGQKAAAWQYEDEWRTVYPEGNVLSPFPGPLTSVIFGAKMDDRDKEIIRNILLNTGIQLKQAALRKGTFDLIIE